jgi:hypothetical protein
MGFSGTTGHRFPHIGHSQIAGCGFQLSAACHGVLTGLVVILDAVMVAPIFERSHAMFRSFNGTWIPFAAILLARLAAGILIPI